MKIATPVICLLSVFVTLATASCGKKNLKTGGSGTGMNADIAAAPVLDIRDGDAAGSEGDIRGGDLSGDFLTSFIFLAINVILL